MRFGRRGANLAALPVFLLSSLRFRGKTIRTICSGRLPCAVRDRSDSAVRMKDYNA
jgi:hypothetical protein